MVCCSDAWITVGIGPNEVEGGDTVDTVGFVIVTDEKNTVGLGDHRAFVDDNANLVIVHPI